MLSPHVFDWLWDISDPMQNYFSFCSLLIVLRGFIFHFLFRTLVFWKLYPCDSGFLFQIYFSKLLPFSLQTLPFSEILNFQINPLGSKFFYFGWYSSNSHFPMSLWLLLLPRIFCLLAVSSVLFLDIFGSGLLILLYLYFSTHDVAGRLRVWLFRLASLMSHTTLPFCQNLTCPLYIDRLIAFVVLDKINLPTMLTHPMLYILPYWACMIGRLLKVSSYF